MDTVGLPEMDEVAAGHPESPELVPDQGPEPGRREVRSSETAAAAAVVGRAEGLRAECCILQKEGERERTEREETDLTSKHSGYLFSLYILTIFTLTRVLHTILLLLWWGTWLLGRVSTWSLVLLVHLT